MPDYLLLMHDDVPAGHGVAGDWASYLGALQQSGHFQGGSAISTAVCARKSSMPSASTSNLSGYIRISADRLDDAHRLLRGNPVYEAGGTVEICALQVTG